MRTRIRDDAESQVACIIDIDGQQSDHAIIKRGDLNRPKTCASSVKILLRLFADFERDAIDRRVRVRRVFGRRYGRCPLQRHVQSRCFAWRTD